jgi:hypothetical protein
MPVMSRHPFLRRVSIGALLLAALFPASAGRAGVLTVGSAFVAPGGATVLPVTVNAGVSNVAGIDLTLTVESPLGAPPLAVDFGTGSQTGDWIGFVDPQNALRYTLETSSGNAVKGPAELIKLTVKVSPQASPGVTYRLKTVEAFLFSENGLPRDVTASTTTALLTVPRRPGDVNGDDAITLSDVQLLLQIYLGIRTPTPEEFNAGDTQPATVGLPYGDGRIRANDLNWLLRKVAGLENAP